jgi:hypothetical protein
MTWTRCHNAEHSRPGDPGAEAIPASGRTCQASVNPWMGGHWQGWVTFKPGVAVYELVFSVLLRAFARMGTHRNSTWSSWGMVETQKPVGGAATRSVGRQQVDDASLCSCICLTGGDLYAWVSGHSAGECRGCIGDVQQDWHRGIGSTENSAVSLPVTGQKHYCKHRFQVRIPSNS